VVDRRAQQEDQVVVIGEELIVEARSQELKSSFRVFLSEKNLSSKEYGVRIIALRLVESFIKLLVLQCKESTNTFKSTILRAILARATTQLFPLFLRLLHLIAADQCDYQVHLYQSPLLSGKVNIILELLSDSFSELVPIEVSNDVLHVLLVKAALILFVLRECAHVDLD
jgi:hypothetical protein